MRMQRGVFSTRCAPYGYRLVDNQLEVIEDEAVVIRQIFDRYLSGVSMEDIAKEITAWGIPTKQNTPFWQVRSIQYILRNEKYIGNSLVQKTYATATLPHRKKENKGEEDQYLIEETHPPIVSQEVFDKVQQLLSRKSAFIPPRASAPHPFSCKIVCGHCGAICKRKVCRGTAYWVCQTHEKSGESCLTMQTPESEITEASSVYTSVSSGTGRKFSHNSSKLSRLPRPEDFSGVRISFHSTIESQILQVRNDCWPSSSSRPSSILTFLYPAATNWLNSAARQS